MSEALNELAELTADVRAWLDWEAALGAYALPREALAPPVMDAAPIQPAAPSKPSVTPASPPAAAPAPGQNRWSSYAKGPELVQVEGPAPAPLCVIRSAGSSEEAEAMFDKMLDKVVGMTRGAVAVVDLARVRRPPRDFALAVEPYLERIQPSTILIMGTLGARALLGPTADVDAVRGQWHSWPLPSGDVPARVTHHPEVIRLQRQQGNPVPAQQAFKDLQAVAQRFKD